eukprot:snap_masked-scaffold_20-processed-gene-4.32-mRNA-1 protein AED:1.00 eAED:1.00 QI:0/0/0/0/1/1/2/0/256
MTFLKFYLFSLIEQARLIALATFHSLNTPTNNLNNVDFLDVLADYGLQQRDCGRYEAGAVLFPPYQTKPYLLYFQYLVKNVVNVNCIAPGMLRLISTCTLAGQCNLPMVIEFLQVGFDLSRRVKIRPCLSNTSHRIYRWEFKDLVNQPGYSDYISISFSCDMCNRRIENDEHLMELNGKKTKKNKCNFTLCDDCTLYFGEGYISEGISTKELVQGMSAPGKLFYANLFHFCVLPLVREYKEKTKLIIQTSFWMLVL